MHIPDSLISEGTKRSCTPEENCNFYQHAFLIFFSDTQTLKGKV